MNSTISKFKTIMFISLTVILITLLLGVCDMVYAAEKTDKWEYTDYSVGYYVPRTGNMKVTTSVTDSGVYKVTTKVTMKFNATNVSRIKLYNSGSEDKKVHEKCRGKKTYLTCDVTSDTGSSVISDNMHATSVTSNLPNPKYDLENDNGNWDDYKEESETVALGTIEAQSYTMTTKWNDKRGKNGAYGGKFLCQYSMSKKGLSDYNTVIVADGIQATVSYCKERGKL